MFGTKFKIWMENHIGRPKKKSPPEKVKMAPNPRGRGIILESSESLAQSDTGISSGSQQVLSSCLTDNKEGSYCTTTLESERSGMTHCLTAISLPSPESAYSTGYSTDGASPGGTGPPEYYINIRTGKHYFPSPAPTPTSPQPNATFSPLHSGNQCFATSFLVNESCSLPPVPVGPPPPPGNPLQKSGSLTSTACIRSRFPVNRSNGMLPVLNTFGKEPFIRSGEPDGIEVKPNTLSTSVPSHFELFSSFSKSPCKKSSSPKSQLSTLKLFLKSPKQDKRKEKAEIGKTPSFDNKKRLSSPTKNKKWYKQPFQKFGQKKPEPFENDQKTEVKKEVFFDKNLYYLTKENTSSPRQRNRIKTNPWLPTEPMSSQNFHNLPINFSPSFSRNRSCTNTPLQNRKSNEKPDPIQSRMKELNARYEESKEYLAKLDNVVNRHVAGKQIYLELSDHSEEDITLNEMMGTYNESYVYEKETDILSDSDPTDCEDYVSDSEADNGGDEQDSHDDELDFIDNGSITETDDNFAGNTGKCTYHDVYLKKSSFLYKSDRHQSRKESDTRKSFRKEKDAKGRKSREEKKRRSARRSFKCEEEETTKREPEKAKVELNENVGGLNLSRVLMQRMIARNGSKSAEGTPVSLRRQNLIKELRETHIGGGQTNGNTGNQVNGLPSDILLVDIEGDRKYNELITEAENMFQSMQNSPVILNRKKIITSSEDSDKLMESIDIWKKAEKMCEPGFPLRAPETTTPRKSPKHLGLKLRMEDGPKALKHFDFGKDGKKSGFKAKSSAHSPLDPLGPTFRNFSVFKPVNIDDEKVSLSSSEDSEPQKPKQWICKDVVPKGSMAPESPMVPIAFQSIDLGKPLMSYCPQSEPVKRKIYTCSKTYDKLVKRFENTPQIFEESPKGPVRHGSLMTKTRPDGVQTKLRGSGPPKNPLTTEAYLNGGGFHPPGTSPRRASAPNGPPKPNPSLRHPLCTDAIR